MKSGQQQVNDNCDKCVIQFMPDKNQFEKQNGDIKTKLKITVEQMSQWN